MNGMPIALGIRDNLRKAALVPTSVTFPSDDNKVRHGTKRMRFYRCDPCDRSSTRSIEIRPKTESSPEQQRRDSMQTAQKIMVAVDLSDYSPLLVKYAHQLALRLGSKIILVNVYNQRDISSLQQAINTFDPKLCDAIIKDNTYQRRKFLDDLVKEAGAEDIVPEKFVVVGVPYLKLLEVIEKEKPDLLVMGTKGRSNLADTIVGSCAQKMYRRSPIPMLSLRWNDISDKKHIE